MNMMDCRSAEDLTEIDRARIRHILRRAGRDGFQTETGGSHARDVVSGIGAPWISQMIRVPPSRARAMQAVDRLMNAAEKRLLTDPLRNVTIDAIARDACMSKQAAFRYFTSLDDLMRAVLRRAQTRYGHDLSVHVSHAAVTCDADLADRLVAFVVSSYRSVLAAPTVAQVNVSELLNRYHIPGDQLLFSAAAVVNAVRRYDPAACDPMLETRLAVSLAGIADAAKAVLLYDVSLLGTEAFHETLVGILLAALAERGRA